MLRTVQLRNTTSDSLTVGEIVLETPQKAGFQVRSECKDLMPGQTCLVSIVWSPIVQGPTSGFLVVHHSGTAKILNIPVQGEYTPADVSDVTSYPKPIAGKGLLVASSQKVAFGDAVDSESAITLTLVNGGDTDLTLKDLSLSVVTPGLAIDPAGCRTGAVIKPDEGLRAHRAAGRRKRSASSRPTCASGMTARAA